MPFHHLFKVTKGCIIQALQLCLVRELVEFVQVEHFLRIELVLEERYILVDFVFEELVAILENIYFFFERRSFCS